MTLTLFLEDNYGKSTSIAVQPEDTFQTFLQNAKSILGYDVDISSITGTEQVLLDDNVYQFLIKARLNLQEQEIKESSTDLVAAGEIELPAQEESSLLDDDMQEDIIYILDDNAKDNASHLGFVDSFGPGTSSEFFLRNNIGDDSVSYIVYESEQEDGCMYILDDGVINASPEGAAIVKLENASEPLSNEINSLEPINKNSIVDINVNINQSKNAALLDPSAANTFNSKGLARVIKNSTANNTEFEKVQMNKTAATPTTLTALKPNIINNISINSRTILQRNINLATPKIVAKVPENSQSFCTFCKRKITNELSKSYIFDSDNAQSNRGFNKKDVTIPKLICLYCLKNDYEAYDHPPKKLNTDDFLVIQNKLQKFYKKKAGVSREKNTEMDIRLYPTGGTVVEKYSVDSFNVFKNPPVIDVDNTRIIKKECPNIGYVCRICGLDLKELRLAIPHSVTHMTEMKKPAVFSCILCPNNGYSQFQELRHHMQSEHSLMKQRMTQQNAKKVPKLNAITHMEIKNERISDKSVKNKGATFSKSVEVIEVPPKNYQDGDDSLEMAEVEWLDEDTGLMVNILRVVEKEEFDIEEGEYVSSNENYGSSSSNKMLDHAYFENQNNDGDASDSDSDSGVWIVQSGDVWLEGQDVEVPLDNDQKPTVENQEVVQEELQSVMIAPRMHQCRDCKKRYTTAERMARHVCHFKLDSDSGHFESSNKMAGENGSHRCPFCDSTFHTKIRLQFHTRHFHLSSANAEEGESSTLAAGAQSLRCSMCPQKMFESEATLYDHIHFAHPRVRRHVCPEEGCGKAFHLKASLNNHIRSHAGERTHRCEVCGKQFFDRQTLGEHSVTHLKVKPFQCHICLKFLNRRSRLRMHLLTHESEPIGAMVITCGNCDMAFKDTEQAEAHLNELGQCCESTEIQNPDSPSTLQKKAAPSKDDTSNTIENVDSMKPRSNLSVNKNKAGVLTQEDGDHLQIPDSSLLDGLSDVAKKTMTAVKIDKVYRCEYCEKVYSVQDALNVHRSCHEGLKNPFICHICGATFSTYSRCTTHKTTHGYYRNNSSRSEGSLVTTSNHDQFPVVKHFLCEVCGKSYLHWTYLQVHRRQKHSDNVHMYKCRLCGDEFPNSWGIAYHRKKAHGQTSGSAAQASTPMPAIEKFNYSCTECGVVVKNKAQLLVHKRSCHAAANANSSNSAKQGLYSCMECGKRYITQVGLKGHMKSHHEPDSGGRPHRCQECGKTFVHATGLTTHGRRVHMKETNFACSNCGKTFYSACDLQSHLRRHTGERPFRCDVCGHAFRTKGMRNEHLRIHTGERPYPCDICGLAFRRSYAMKNHRLIHTGERRYRCSLCPRAFRVRADLNTHFRHKHGTEPTASDGQAPVMVVNMSNEFTVNHQEEIHIDLNNMKAEQIESLEGRVDPSGIIIFNEQGVESVLQNEQVLRLQKPNNMAIKTINSGYSNNAKTKGALRSKEILSDNYMMFDDSGDNVYVNDTQESIFLSDDGRFVIDNDTEIIGQLSVDGNSLIVMSKDGDERILNVNDLQINSDENVLLRGVTIETVDSFVEDNYNSEDLLPEGGVKVWSDAEDSESGQVDDVNMEGSKSPDDARRFNELFSSSVANN